MAATGGEEAAHGGELDCECASGTHKGSYRRRGAPSQGQPKWGELDKEQLLRDKRGQKTMKKGGDKRECSAPGPS